ncbi:hypothetical protein Cgig2_024142 [Carnegiea gigantea]|uniref:Protein kinase domain-containing protein n=1 Tax=Carnegiea gigantea TaxID=171969 RepID=A0A9Q1KAV3_9CARY|nr:hypothetical protein Cgig2_024142 [Carnegiea gigantea]
MVPFSTAPATILVGTCLDEDDAKELISWAIKILSNTNDTIVALHVLVGKEPKKLVPKSRDYKRFRRAKSFLLSTMAEFAKACQPKQVHLEARVRYGSSIGGGLIDEAKKTTAEFLVLGRSKSNSNVARSGEVTKYCSKHAPKGCSVISIGQLQKQELLDSSLKDQSGKTSPRTVLKGVDERESTPSTEDDVSRFGDSSSNSESPPPPPPTTTAKCKQSPLMRVASFFLRSPSSRRGNCNTEISSSNEVGKLHQPHSLRCFSFDEISRATKDFHPDNMVGQGGYSEVYRGDVTDGNSIAVKRLAKDNSNPNKEREFLVELGIISHVSHPNTASVIGYCIENGLYLIFQFIPNGNLFTALHGNSSKSLEWEVRYKIALGVARGLHYLHKCCKHRIIHRDIKASNVLLGPDYEPQITDFGLAKWLPNKGTNHAILPIEGTFGYLAPEYFMHGIVDEKTDVFAFGILLLEIVTGRRPVDSSKQSLLLWAMPLMESGKISELVDPRLGSKYDADQVYKVVHTASCCIRQSSAWRPSMTEVLELLTNIGEDYELARKWGLQKSSSSGEMDDYSMVFGYHVPIDINLQKAVAALEI